MLAALLLRAPTYARDKTLAISRVNACPTARKKARRVAIAALPNARRPIPAMATATVWPITRVRTSSAAATLLPVISRTIATATAIARTRGLMRGPRAAERPAAPTGARAIRIQSLARQI
jgi:hypothetical protein